MLVSHDLKLLFAHVPKTGGSSITAALRPHLQCNTPEEARQPIDTPGWQNQWHAFGGMHSKFDAVKDMAQPLLDDGYRMCTSVRSPFERLASMWAIKTKAGMPNAGMDPYTFLTTTLPGHCLHTIEDMTGPRLEFIIRFEDIERGWRDFCDQVGADLELPHANKQVGVDKAVMDKVYSDPRCVDFVVEHLESDIAPFGYKLPGFEPEPFVEPEIEPIFGEDHED